MVPARCCQLREAELSNNALYSIHPDYKLQVLDTAENRFVFAAEYETNSLCLYVKFNVPFKKEFCFRCNYEIVFYRIERGSCVAFDHIVVKGNRKN